MYGGYYGLGYSLFDPTMILVYIGALLSLWASSKVNSTFQRYSRVRSMTGMTGAEAAKRLLQSQGIYDVTVRPVRGQLTDHYDPRTKTVNLSESVYGSTSIAAVGVWSCHSGQCGVCAAAPAFRFCADRKPWQQNFPAPHHPGLFYRTDSVH